jgi:hypothetical protein
MSVRVTSVKINSSNRIKTFRSMQENDHKNDGTEQVTDTLP